jgi:hypothetical protein
MNVLNCRGCGSLVYTSTQGFPRGCCPDYGGQEYNSRNIYLELRAISERNGFVWLDIFFQHYELRSHADEANSFAISQIRIY